MPKPLGPCSHSPAPSARLAPCSPQNHPLGPAGLLGANPNPMSAREGPIPRGLALQRCELGTTDPQCQTYPLSSLPPGPSGRRQSFRAGEQEGPSELQAFSKAGSVKTLGPTRLLPSAFTSTCPSVPHTAVGSSRPATWGLTLTIVRPLRGPSQGAWCHNAGDW